MFTYTVFLKSHKPYRTVLFVAKFDDQIVEVDLAQNRTPVHQSCMQVGLIKCNRAKSRPIYILHQFYRHLRKLNSVLHSCQTCQLPTIKVILT